MRFQKGIIFLVMLSVVCMTLTGCCMKHEFSEATCTQAATCVKCGETNGETLEHVWMAATCTTPQTCSVCGKVQGNTIDHIAGEWETSMDLIDIYPTYSSKRYCVACGEEMYSKGGPLESFAVGNVFLFSPEQFAERLTNVFDKFDIELTASAGEVDGTCGIGILDEQGEVECVLLLAGSDGRITPEQIDEEECFGLILTVSDCDATTTFNIMLGLMITCDPNMMQDEQVVSNAARLAGKSYSIERNGITYVTEKASDSLIIAIALDQNQ